LLRLKTAALKNLHSGASAADIDLALMQHNAEVSVNGHVAARLAVHRAMLDRSHLRVGVLESGARGETDGTQP
jgi:hypothetical protein